MTAPEPGPVQPDTHEPDDHAPGDLGPDTPEAGAHGERAHGARTLCEVRGVRVEAAGRGTGDDTGTPRLIRAVPGGPLLVEGPVELVTPDGQRTCSDRFMVAVCACRRSRNYPLCDTSHRRKVRTD